MKKIIRFFDRMEDLFRARLSRRPIIYSLIGSIGIVLFWRGIWLIADMFPFMTGPVSAAAGLIILLLTGLLVSFFIGEQIIISGVKRDKRIDEKTEDEIRADGAVLREIKSDINQIKKEIEKIIINKNY